MKKAFDLDIFDDQDPFVIGIVFGREPLVSCEWLLPGRQDVHVPMSHPGHLKGQFLLDFWMKYL